MDRPAPFKPHGILLLMQLKLRTLSNMIHQALRNTPFKVLSAVCVVAVIWSGLFMLFHMVF